MTNQNRPMISLIIITHNNAQDILSCLGSLPWKKSLIELILIDNKSSDQTCTHIRSFMRDNPVHPIRLISNPFNTGYAAAVNQGLTLAQGEWICVLGPDTILHPGMLHTLQDRLEKNPNLGIAVPQLLRSDNSIQSSCRRFPGIRDVLFELTGLPRLWPRYFQPRWKMVDFEHNSERIVDQPEATCLFIRRKAILEVGPMDEQFPIFFNDVDWCRRFHLKGWRLLFTPSARVTHRQGTSVNVRPVPMIWKSHQGFYRYFRKYSRNRMMSAALPAFGLLLILTACLRTAAFMAGLDRASLIKPKQWKRSQKMR
jgi:N-acetylglucosaminyl-diphospho-decaprenol L-rhamnosyltransferase